VPTFDRLAAELAPGVTLTHCIDESLLCNARQDGLTPVLAEQVATALRTLAAQGPRVALCTCSTIGSLAEQQGQHLGLLVLRVDRAMAARAVALGCRIVVVAALASTVEPTIALIMEEAQRAAREVGVLPAPCPWAWEAFETGDAAGYRSHVAAHVRAVAHQGDVVVLAQASMADAAKELSDLEVPVLTSPRLGLAAALAAL
jgi:hypothetical protein